MCTAISYLGNHHFFGRNLDIDVPYEEQVVITPRQFPLPFRRLPSLEHHHALIGIATVSDGYPLYYDAVNEHGLAMAGLRFPCSCRYFPEKAGRHNVTPFELIPWVLGQCATLKETQDLLSHTNLLDEAFSARFPLSPLHWMIADAGDCLVVESTREGLQIYPNPIRVLTNDPPFPLQRFWLNNYLGLSKDPPENTFDPHLDLTPYSCGMGGLGLPGDLSSSSRFVRAAFARSCSSPCSAPAEDLAHFFRLLQFVAQPLGCVRLETGRQEYTYYSSCCDTATGTYYYSTYFHPQITAVSLPKKDLDTDRLLLHPFPPAQPGG